MNTARKALSGIPHKKRARATKAEMLERRVAIANIVGLIQPCTVRQAFYQAEVASLVEKAESGYEKVQRAIVWLRQERYVPFGHIADATRWMRKPRSFTSIEDALRDTVECYRRAVRRDAAAYVEFWLENDALAGSIYPVTSEFDVPLMVARGFSSLTFLYEAAEAIAAYRQASFYLPSGRFRSVGPESR